MIKRERNACSNVRHPARILQGHNFCAYQSSFLRIVDRENDNENERGGIGKPTDVYDRNVELFNNFQLNMVSLDTTKHDLLRVKGRMNGHAERDLLNSDAEKNTVILGLG